MNRTSYRCSFCGGFSYFPSVDSCHLAPAGTHQYVRDLGFAHACAHCGGTSRDPHAGECRQSPYGTHEWT